MVKTVDIEEGDDSRLRPEVTLSQSLSYKPQIGAKGPNNKKVYTTAGTKQGGPLGFTNFWTIF